MAEIKTRIQLKYDTYANWQSANTTLNTGEIAIATLATNLAQEANATTKQPILFKVGPGKFNDLPWASALAADVYAWAKQSDVAVSGSGNAITGATISGDKLTFTKGETFATKAELEAVQGALEADTDLDTRYDFAIVDGKLQVTKQLYKLGAAEGEATVTSYDFITPEELTTTLTSYYTKAQADAAIATALQTAKEYADANDANTAHTHAAGSGTKVSATGGIDGEVKVNLNIAFELVDNTIKLYDKDDTTKTAIATLDASEFVKDSYLSSAAYNDVTHILTLTFIDNDDNLQPITVDLSDLVDVYAADEITLTKNGSTFKIKDGGVTKAKLSTDVQASLALADSAIQEHQDISGKLDANGFTTTTNGELRSPKYGGGSVGAQLSDSGLQVVGGAGYLNFNSSGIEGRVDTGDNGTSFSVLYNGIKINTVELAYPSASGTLATTADIAAATDALGLGALAIKDKVSSTDLADEIFIFNCGSATEII